MAIPFVDPFVESMFEAWYQMLDVTVFSLPGHPLAREWMNAVASMRDETEKKFRERGEPIEIFQDDQWDAMVAMDQYRYTDTNNEDKVKVKWIVRVMPFPPTSVLQDVDKWSEWCEKKCWHEVPNFDWLNKSEIVKALRDKNVPITVHDRHYC